MAVVESTGFLEHLRGGVEAGGFATDDVVYALVPLMKQAQQLHDRGQVAPLDGVDALRVTDGASWFENAQACAPRSALISVNRLQRNNKRAVEVVGRSLEESELGVGVVAAANEKVSEADGEMLRPVHVVGYCCWEHRMEHHDALTDVYSLGMLLASLACGLDFHERKELEAFVDHRGNLFALNERLHPVVASVIEKMTELNRHKRAQDLVSLISVLENYRDQPAEFDLDVEHDQAFQVADVSQKRRIIHRRLKNRVFEISKRNRLIYFRQTASSLNLTVGSVPLMLDYNNIRPNQLLYWRDEISQLVKGGRKLALEKYLRFEDVPYLRTSLDGIRRETARDEKEYGFSQLRLVIAFFRWHNLKEAPKERIHSPLLLLPVDLKKKKGIKDTYAIHFEETNAQVNPALRYYLEQLYDLRLPESIDLNETSVDEFYETMRKLIAASDRAVTLKKVERPQIDLIQKVARQRLDKYERRRGMRGKGVRRFENIDYSYDRFNYRPLGYQLFSRRIKPAKSSISDVFEADPQPRFPFITESGEKERGDASEISRKREFYALREGSGSNPYVWDFDTCSLTLGNFNYRKMTLVRDYNVLQSESIENDTFDELFSLEPSSDAEVAEQAIPLEEQCLIVPADPTQLSAIGHAREDRNFIIQGPPGTGKSQTITNLIADYVSRGQRVLFVCEKRAAIDVVFNRLKQCGLEVLSCLIHDSQADKKAFVHNLRHTYELFSKRSHKEVEAKEQARIAKRLQKNLDLLDVYSKQMSTDDSSLGISLIEVLDRLIGLEGSVPELKESELSTVPSFSDWKSHSDVFLKLGEGLESIGFPAALGATPFGLLKEDWIQSGSPSGYLQEHVSEVVALLDSLRLGMTEYGIPPNIDIGLLKRFVSFVTRLRRLGENENLDVLVEHSSAARDLDIELKEFRSLERKGKQAAKKNGNWKEKLSAEDTHAALGQAKKFEGNFLCFLFPAYWSLRGVMNRQYDFSKHAIKPRWSNVLEELNLEHRAIAALEESNEEARNKYGLESVERFADLVEELRDDAVTLEPTFGRLIGFLKEGRRGMSVPPHVKELCNQIVVLFEKVAVLYALGDAYSFAALSNDLKELAGAAKRVSDLVLEFESYYQVPLEVRRAYVDLRLDADAYEGAILTKLLEGLYKSNRSLKKQTGKAIAEIVDKVGRDYHALLEQNASVLVGLVEKRFLENFDKSNLPAAQLDPVGKAFKKEYAAGRRVLEHEFGKTMRYKSIRDLSDGANGLVVRDLKPIWLMSPLSVSDCLPIDSNFFDVVIFDEASQIKVEEAVPSLYRARQAIVVGDEMQLPPSNFFSASRDSEEVLQFEDGGEVIEYDLNADSFLNQAGRKLMSTLLGWHYRSRYEALISFSNSAFYEGKLLTIPDCRVGRGKLEPIHVDEGESGEGNVDGLLERSISFHLLEKGLYENRRNKPEARYIAELLRGILNKKTGKTIGIVAFSEAQQAEIEAALNGLGEEDKAFGDTLEKEFDREEDEQFVGLFVKNLENVQGDERDIILISVCYGYDSKGKMLMNFGPINKGGGEKRLNVIFSRARFHMGIVSSIRSSAITNEYNDGAYCLKSFLEYAEKVSCGDLEAGRRVLSRFAVFDHEESGDSECTVREVRKKIEEHLTEKGFCVDTNVGESSFRCDLAVRSEGSSEYLLGILVDSERFYTLGNSFERFYQRPSVLRVFGWKIHTITVQDWYFRRDEVLLELNRALGVHNLGESGKVS